MLDHLGAISNVAAVVLAAWAALAARTKDSRKEAEARLVRQEQECHARQDAQRRELDAAIDNVGRKIEAIGGKMDGLRVDFEAERLRMVVSLADHYARKSDIEKMSREWNDQAVALRGQLAGLDGILRQVQLLSERLKAERLKHHEDSGGGE